ncbi:MAG: hypothetical protein AB7F31_05905 [Parachlamydiales bacterium]
MQFIHYKEYPPINLARVGSIGKENQQVAQGAVVYAIGFYEFERKLGYWVFQTAEERDKVFDGIRKQWSKAITPDRNL